MGRDRRRLFAFILSSPGGGGGGVEGSFVYGSTHVNASAFYAANVVGPVQTITASRHINTPAFYSASLFAGRVINAALFTNTNTFHTSVVTRNNAIAGSLFTDSDAFYTSTVTKIAAPITGSLFTNTNTFQTATVGILARVIDATRHINVSVFYTSSLGHVATLGNFVLDTDSLAAPEAIPAQDITASLHANSNAFHSSVATNALSIFGSKHTNTNTFLTSVTTRGVRNITGVKFNNVPSFKTAVIGTSGGGLPIFPNASNTGVPAGTTLTNSGSVTMNTNGQIIQDLNITGQVTINAANCTVRRCKISGTTTLTVVDAWNGSNPTIEDCEIDGNTAWNGVRVRSGTLRRLNVYQCENSIQVEGNGINMIDCYIHSVQGAPGAHHDNIECNGNTNGFVIDHCNIVNEKGETAAVMLNNWAGALSNVTVQNCRLVGGGFTCYCDNSFGGGPVQGSTIKFLNNRMIPGQWGYFALYTSGAIHTGNVNDNTGNSVD